MHRYRGLNRKIPRLPHMTECSSVDPAFDEGGEPVPKPAIEQDEYAFIEQSLQRYHDRDYHHTKGE